VRVAGGLGSEAGLVRLVHLRAPAAHLAGGGGADRRERGFGAYCWRRCSGPRFAALTRGRWDTREAADRVAGAAAVEESGRGGVGGTAGARAGRWRSRGGGGIVCCKAGLWAAGLS
jgi:hypothetical protein